MAGSTGPFPAGTHGRPRRLWNNSARAGCDGRRTRKPAAFPAVAQVEKGRGGLFPRAATDAL